MDISTLRKALLDPEIYPDHPQEVKLIETHISLVYLTGDYVYKIKKAVDFGFLDFTTLEKRRHFCEQEVSLNRRLSPEIYIGVVRITFDGRRVAIEGDGRVAEYAVKMRQIPEEFLMDKLLERDRVTPKMIEALSEKLARFYSTAETNDMIKGFARPERVKQDTDENFDQTEKYVDVTIDRVAYEEIKSRTNRFLKNAAGMFGRRIAADRVRDCHGDLRLEHIFWGDTISIFDCIEFNERFRYTDVAADIGFLAMDFDYRERGDLAGHLIDAFVESSGDLELMKVLDFYECYRAYVRGKVESFRLDDPNIPDEEKAQASQRAKRYFKLAHRYALMF